MGTLFAIRYDDCSAVSPREAERVLLDTIAAHGFRVTFAVIPLVAAGDWYDVSGLGGIQPPEDLVQLLRDAIARGVIEVAQHGVTHRASSRVSGVRANELAGTGFTHQVEQIGRGKDILEESCGVPVKTFTAPWDAYDSDTLEALAQLGFEVFSQEGRGPFRPGLPVLVPLTCFLSDACRAVAAASREGGVTPVVAIVHPYDLAPQGPLGAQELNTIFSWIAQNGTVDPATLLDVGTALRDGWEARYRAYQWLRFSPAWRLAGGWTERRRRRACLCFGAARRSIGVTVRLWVETAAAYAFGVAGGTYLGLAAGRVTQAAPWAGLAAVTTIVSLAWYDGRPGFRGVWASVMACAFWVGTLAPWI